MCLTEEVLTNVALDTKAWAAKIVEYDGFVFVTAEYNHGIPGALKNAIDYVTTSGTTRRRE